MAYNTITVEIDDHIALIRLNRPDALNAINAELLSELTEAVSKADANDKVRVLVLTGSEKAFAAGADIKEMATKSFVEVFGSDLFGPEPERLLACRKPIIAAVRIGDDVRFHHRI
jgi:enoyl-CoA hydratase